MPTTTVLYSNHRGSLAPLIAPGDPAPGTDFDFTITGYPVLNDADHIVVAAAFPDTDGDPFSRPPYGVWWDQPGELAPALLPGATVGNGLTITSIDFIVGYNSAGVLALMGPMEDAQGAYRNGLVLTDATGALELVAATDEMFDVFGDCSDMRRRYRSADGADLGG